MLPATKTFPTKKLMLIFYLLSSVIYIYIYYIYEYVLRIYAQKKEKNLDNFINYATSMQTLQDSG
jgi:hypothetical protein